MSVSDTLAEREKQHGSFTTHCEVECALRRQLDKAKDNLSPVQYIGLGMVMHKISRILSGGAEHIDSWHDIAGYATLVERDLTVKMHTMQDLDMLDSEVPDFRTPGDINPQ